MYVYSVFTSDPVNGGTELRATFYEDWAAEAYANTTDTDCDRRIIKHQLLNVTELRYMAAGSPSGSETR